MLEQNPYYMLEGRDLGSPNQVSLRELGYLPTEPT